jgi:hypothetical protein
MHSRGGADVVERGMPIGLESLMAFEDGLIRDRTWYGDSSHRTGL